jgi:hypothetical protein
MIASDEGRVGGECSEEEQLLQWLEQRLVARWCHELRPPQEEADDLGRTNLELRGTFKEQKENKKKKRRVAAKALLAKVIAALCDNNPSLAQPSHAQAKACVRHLAQWLFAQVGPSACLSFLAEQQPPRTGQTDADEDEEQQRRDSVKEEIFIALAPSVIHHLSRYGWPEAEQESVVARLCECAGLALAGASSSGGRERVQLTTTLIDCLASTLKNLARPTALKREMTDVLVKAFKHDDCDLLLGTCAHSRGWCCLSDADRLID